MPVTRLGGQVQVLEQHAGVDRHVVDALLGLVLDHVQKVLRRHVADVVQLLHHLVDRHGADRHRRGVDDRLADGVDVAAGREVHHRVGAEVDRRVQLFQLAVDVAGDGRVADVGVDLGAGGDADAHRLQPLSQVHLVGRDDHPAAGHFARISSAPRSSRRATNSISGVTTPRRAISI